jgi:hypothetical protein
MILSERASLQYHESSRVAVLSELVEAAAADRELICSKAGG